MIVHVWRRAVAAEIGPVVVACGDRAIADAVEKVRGRAVMTDRGQPTGSDRIHEAIMRLDPGRRHDAVVNLQGDLPLLDPAAIRAAVAGLADPETDIATLAAVIEDEAAVDDTSVERFVALPRGILEQRERLEQLRALEAGMRISVSLIDRAWLGVQVDTPADLARARQLAVTAGQSLSSRHSCESGNSGPQAPAKWPLDPRFRGGDDKRAPTR